MPSIFLRARQKSIALTKSIDLNMMNPFIRCRLPPAEKNIFGRLRYSLRRYRIKRSISHPFTTPHEGLIDDGCSWLCRSSDPREGGNRRFSTHSIYTIFEDDTLFIPECIVPDDVADNTITFTQWSQGGEYCRQDLGYI